VLELSKQHITVLELYTGTIGSIQWRGNMGAEWAEIEQWR